MSAVDKPRALYSESYCAECNYNFGMHTKKFECDHAVCYRCREPADDMFCRFCPESLNAFNKKLDSLIDFCRIDSDFFVKLEIKQAIAKVFNRQQKQKQIDAEILALTESIFGSGNGFIIQLTTDGKLPNKKGYVKINGECISQQESHSEYPGKFNYKFKILSKNDENFYIMIHLHVKYEIEINSARIIFKNIFTLSKLKYRKSSSSNFINQEFVLKCCQFIESNYPQLFESTWGKTLKEEFSAKISFVDYENETFPKNPKRQRDE